MTWRKLLMAFLGWRPLWFLLTLPSSVRFVVRGQSMAPALNSGDYLLVSRLSYLSSSPRRGEIVVLQAPGHSPKALVKRIVGLPGEHIHLRQDRVLVNGSEMEEPYLTAALTNPSRGENQWLLEEDEFFVLGDNRGDSHDSRSFWPVNKRLIVGKVWFRYWPPRRWGPIGAHRPYIST